MGCYNAEDWRLFVGSLNASLIWVLLQWRQVVLSSYTHETNENVQIVLKKLKYNQHKSAKWEKKNVFVTKLYMIEYFIRFFKMFIK